MCSSNTLVHALQRAHTYSLPIPNPSSSIPCKQNRSHHFHSHLSQLFHLTVKANRFSVHSHASLERQFNRPVFRTQGSTFCSDPKLCPRPEAGRGKTLHTIDLFGAGQTLNKRNVLSRDSYDHHRPDRRHSPPTRPKLSAQPAGGRA